MKPQAPKTNRDVPVAIHCRCGNRIIMEPRWVGKPSACAQCEADFVVSMLVDPKTKRVVPHVQYTPVYMPDKVKHESDGTTSWANVTCECGMKIGLDRRFFGKNMTCSNCGRGFIVRHMPRPRKAGETAIMEFTQPKAKPPSRPPSRTIDPVRAPSIMDLARSAPPPRKGASALPDEMHLLCTCGEELIVPAHFYNRNMYCAGCGALMHLRLEYNESRSKYELLARVLDHPPEGEP
jgi:hypothetical protein